MRPDPVSLDLGVFRRGGKAQPKGALLEARNTRYIDGDPESIHALLGRALFNADPPPLASINPADSITTKRLFPIFFNNGARKLVWHRGGVLYEADLASSGSFTQAYALATAVSELTPRGNVAAYGNKWFYFAGSINGAAWNAARSGFVRTSAGWRRAGHRQPQTQFTAAPQGIGSLSTSFPVRYMVRIYDSSTDSESQHSSLVLEVPVFTNVASILLSFPNGIVSASDIGTHARIYRSLFNQAPGLFYRIDGIDEGIPLATAGPAYTFTDDADNTEIQVNGLVRADGIEGTDTWAEHGGPVPPARGFLIYDDRAVVWGVPGRESQILWSVQGQPELFPVDFDGEYVYYQPLETKQVDEVQTCLRVGRSLLVLAQNSIHAIETLPDFTNPLFDTRAMRLVTDEDGVVGPDAACTFPFGPQQAQLGVYLSRKGGLMLTDSVYTRGIVSEFDVASLIDPAYLNQTELVNYPEKNEIWVFYVPTGGNARTQAAIISYANQGGKRAAFRATWPIDVKEGSACYGVGADGVGRFYIADNDGRVFVQDSGNVDAQQNTNVAGDIVVTVATSRLFPSGQSIATKVGRVFVYGRSGAARLFTATHHALDGNEEYSNVDKVQIGAGETSDHFGGDLAGQAHRFTLTYQGPTGSTYDEGAAGQAPAIKALEVELVGGGQQARTRGA